MTNLRIEALILALGLVVLGLLFRSGIALFVDKDRVVAVKGLAEMEVNADKVIWPLSYKEMGNNPTEIYAQISEKNAQIVDFLKQNGVAANEISVNPPRVSDRSANEYNNAQFADRYVATSTITVTSSHVDVVRRLMQRQTELLKRGIAVGGNDYETGQVSYEFTKLNDIKPKMI